MSRIAALGEPRRLEGFALAGVPLFAGEDPDQLRTAWASLDPEVTVVILTTVAEGALRDLLDLRPDVIWTTLPD